MPTNKTELSIIPLVPFGDSIERAEIIFNGHSYKVTTIECKEAPHWLTNYKEEEDSLLRYSDQIFHAVMSSSQLHDDVIDYIAKRNSDIYIDAIIYSQQGRKIVIKDATATNLNNKNIILIGTTFAFMDTKRLKE